MLNPVYALGTYARHMSIDGWSSGFGYRQTLEEMEASGVEITLTQLKEHWRKLDQGVIDAANNYTRPVDGSVEF